MNRIGGLSTTMLVIATSVLLLMSWTPPAHGQFCLGDCDGNGSVDVDDLNRMVNIALGLTDLTTCQAADLNGDGEFTIDEMVGPAMRRPCGPARRADGAIGADEPQPQHPR